MDTRPTEQTTPTNAVAKARPMGPRRDATRPKGGRFAPPPKAADNKGVIPNSPFEAATKVLSTYIESLDEEFRSTFSKHARAVLQAYATHFRNKMDFERQKDDDTFIPQPCRHVLTLQPYKNVEKDNRFKDLLRETDVAVKNAQLLMKKSYMKCIELNVESLKFDIAKAFVIAMPAIAKLQLASDDLLDVSVHLVMADLLTHQKVDILSFLGTTENKVAELYCQFHQLDSFPQPSNPPLFQAHPTQAQPTRVLQIRGGSGEHDPGRGRGRGIRTPNPYSVSQTPNHSGGRSAAQQSQARPARHDVRGINLHRERLAAEQAATHGNFPEHESLSQFDYNEGGDGTHTSDAQNNHNAQRGVTFNAGADDDTAGGATPPDDNGGGGNNNNNSAQGEEVEGGFVDDIGVPPAPQTTYNTAAELLQREKLKTLHLKLVDYMNNLFVRPREIYKQKVEQNAKRARIQKVAKELETTTLADSVAEAIQAEGTATPRTIKILIRKSVEEAVANRAKKQQGKSNSSSSNSGGGQRQGGARQKKKSPTPPQPSNQKTPKQSKKSRGKKSGGRGSGNASDGGSSRGKSPRPNNKSRGNGKRSSTSKQK